MPITSAGVGSGLDLEGIIKALVDAENKPKLATLAKREAALTTSLSGVGQVKSALSTLNTAIEALDTSAEFALRTSKVTPAGTNPVISVSTQSTSTPGDFQIEVTQLAQGSRAESTLNAFASTASTVTASGGTLSFAAGAKSFNITLAANATLADLRDAINGASDNFGVSANIINTGAGSTLVYTSSETGAGNDLTVTNDTAELDLVSTQANGGGAGGMSIAAADQAKDATMLIDGISVSSSSNIFLDAIQDTTITALETSPAGVTDKMSIETDKDTIKTKIEAFVTGYNGFIDAASSVYSPAGALASDSGIRSTRDQVVDAISRTVTGAGNFTSLFDLGIKLDNFGKLSFSSTYGSLDDALTSSYADVGNFFAGADGLALTMKSTLDSYLGSGGIMSDREEDINAQLKKVATDKSSHEYRMELLEKRVREQYSALDVLVAQFQATGSYLTAQLQNLPGFTSKK